MWKIVFSFDNRRLLQKSNFFFFRTTITKLLYEDRLSCSKQEQFLSRFEDIWKSEQNTLFIISVFRAVLFQILLWAVDFQIFLEPLFLRYYLSRYFSDIFEPLCFRLFSIPVFQIFFELFLSDIFMSRWFSDTFWAVVYQILFEPLFFR